MARKPVPVLGQRASFTVKGHNGSTSRTFTGTIAWVSPDAHFVRLQEDDAAKAPHTVAVPRLTVQP